MNIIKKLPLATSGLMLAFAALGNLFSSYGEIFKNFFGLLSGLLFILILLKLIILTEEVIMELEDPLVLSVFSTFTMGMMLLSTYLKTFSYFAAYAFWILSLILHISLIVLFTKRHMLKFDIKKVLPSYFIVYVGIVIGSVTAPIYHSEFLGQLIFYFGFTAYLILLPIVAYRVFLIGKIADSALPTITIFTAPASLCLAAYLSSFPDKSLVMIEFLVFLSVSIFALVVFYMPKMIRSKFYPSYSAFTFPLVISAIAIKLTNGFLVEKGTSYNALRYLVNFEEFFALSVVIYVSFKYIAFLTQGEKVRKSMKASNK